MFGRSSCAAAGGAARLAGFFEIRRAIVDLLSW
jgi:hypothetical protein